MHSRSWSPDARRRLSSRSAALTALVAVTSVACTAGDGGDAASSTTTDSAGVEIVRSTRPSWPDASAWRVDSEPSLSVGAAEGDPALLFAGVRAAVRLSDGRIVVADAGSSQLRFFDSTGHFLTAAGRKGGGPGEFEFLTGMWRLPGDTLAAGDLSPRVSFFDPSGRYLHTVQLRPEADMGIPNPVAMADDGSFLSLSGSRGFNRADRGLVIHDTLRFGRITADGTGGALFGRFPSQERWGLGTGNRTSFPRLPFSSPPSWAGGGDRFAGGSGRVGEVSIWHSDGTLALSVRWPAEERPVTADLLARYREESLAEEPDPNERRRVEQFLAEAPVAELLPVYQSLRFDDGGRLWVEEYRPWWEPEPSWLVFDRGGQWLGRVRTPPRLDVFQIGDDFVLGSWRDENDVEHVRMYPLVKPR